MNMNAALSLVKRYPLIIYFALAYSLDSAFNTFGFLMPSIDIATRA